MDKTLPRSSSKINIVRLIAAGAAALLLVYFFWPTNDEREIRKILDELVDASNHAAKAPFLEQLSIIRHSGRHLAEQVNGTLRSGEDERTYSFLKKEVEERAAAAAKQSWRSLEVKLTDVSIRAERPKAVADFELHILGALQGVEGKFYERWAIKAGFNRSDGNWLIESIDGEDLRKDPSSRWQFSEKAPKLSHPNGGAMDFSEAKVLVTGGSKGIGKEIARQLIDAGAQVVITARGVEPLEATAAEIGARYVPGDVSEEKSVREIFASARQQLGGLNVVINNAAGGYFAPIHEIDLPKFEALLRTNLIGAMLVGRESAKIFVEQSGGNIVNISSSAGVSGFAGGSAYCASKFALKGMTECWRAELRKHNVRVMLVNPSEVQTGFGGRPGRETGPVNPTKLIASDIAAAVVSLLALPERAFVTEMSVWATNPR